MTEPETISADPWGQTTERERAAEERSVGRSERLLTTGVGGALLAAGLRRRGLGGAAMAAGGGWLVARGLAGKRLRDIGPMAVSGRDSLAEGPVTIERAITVGRPADELLAYWRDPERVSRIVGPVAEVTDAGEDRHRWEVRPPRGPPLSWETEIVEERAGEILRWESLEGAAVPNEGEVRFRPAPGDRGTEVRLRIRFDPPGGTLGAAAVRRLEVVPKSLDKTALRRFKSLAETGEIPTLEANPSARGSGDLL